MCEYGEVHNSESVWWNYVSSIFILGSLFVPSHSQKQRRLCELVIIKHVGLNGFECRPSLPLSAQGYAAVSGSNSFAALMQSNTSSKTLQQWRFPKTCFKMLMGTLWHPNDTIVHFWNCWLYYEFSTYVTTSVLISINHPFSFLLK